jgi:TonB family protein
MQKRDVSIPIALWMCAAVCFHFLGGAGGLVVADVHDDRSELWKLSREASSLAQRDERTFEVALSEPGEEPTEPVPPPPEPATPPPPKHEPTPLIEPPKPQQEKREEEKKAEEKRLLAVEKAEKKPEIPPQELVKDRRIAVRQHVRPDQEDNPKASFIGDEANHVEHESVATQTSHDRDDEQPTPAAKHDGSEPQPGDSEKNVVGEHDNHAGEKNRAPGERGTDFDVLKEAKIPHTTQPAGQAPAPGGHPASTPGPTGAPSAAAQREPAPAPGGATPPSPEVVAGGSGWTFNPARTGGATGDVSRPTAGAPSSAAPGGRLYSLPGLGQSGPPGSMNVNLDQNQVASIVGSDTLRHLREADGERRRSEHRGSFAASNFEKWRSAIENYVSSVKPGNQTALNTARSPFATYINGMHNRIHPIFAESFLEGLDSLPATHPLNDQKLMTRLEIVLTPQGHLKKMGIVTTSGVTAFDIAALDSVDRAQPFGPAPSAIISPDGNVYLHWEFHRDETYACSTWGAFPFIVNTPAPAREPGLPPAPPPAGPTRERGTPPSSPNDSRQGTAPRRPRIARDALRPT